MILHVNATQPAASDKVRIQFRALVEAPPAQPESKIKNTAEPEYPGYVVVGCMSVTLSAAEAALFTEGKQFNLVLK